MITSLGAINIFRYQTEGSVDASIKDTNVLSDTHGDMDVVYENLSF